MRARSIHRLQELLLFGRPVFAPLLVALARRRTLVGMPQEKQACAAKAHGSS
jgi:hypothetical protein